MNSHTTDPKGSVDFYLTINGLSQKIAMDFGRIVANIEVLKNREDSSDFDDSWTV